MPPAVLIMAMDVAVPGAPASRRHAREARDEDAGETPPASARAGLLPEAAATDPPHRYRLK